MKNIILIAMIITNMVVIAQDRKGDIRLNPNASKHRLYVSFKQNLPGYDSHAISGIFPEFSRIANTYGITLKKAVKISEGKLAEMQRQAAKLTGSAAAVNKLQNIVQVSIANPTNERLLELAFLLESYDAVEYCSLISASPLPPPADIMPVTPLAENWQLYMGDQGVNMDYAWQMGLTGEGIRIRDIEYGFNGEHEDLSDVNLSIAPGMQVSSLAPWDYPEHGTAVMGIMYGHKGAYGISGMAYGAEEALLFPEWQPEALGDYDRINAVTQCLENSIAGDIVVYEMQDMGPQGDFGPAEINQVIWDMTKAASDVGIVIIAAAGNGNENLDHALYQSYRNRGHSGAIIVGAGSPDGFHSKLDYSTYGARVDLQAWGGGVYTTGYGDFLQVGNDFNQSYTFFGGTSAATPIVASCAVVLQGYYHNLTGNYLTGTQLRDLMVETGTSQGAFPAGNIGPIPNMEAAIAGMAALLSSQTAATDSKLIAFPNPVEGFLNIPSTNFSDHANAEVYNALGQVVHSGPISGTNGIDFSSFSVGVYTVKVADGNKVQTRKIIKK